MKYSVKYPVGIQSFSKIREDNFIYVDKTEIIYRLVKNGRYYFLSRPRRFGKSLLLNTIKAYFEGHRNLFEGLAIARLEKEWKRYPVLSLSLASYDPSKKNLDNILSAMFCEYEEQYNVVDQSEDLGMRFRKIIRSAYEKTGERVVILIDEYDAPLVAHLNDDSQREIMRDALKSIYTNLKDMDDYIQFGFLAGVSRFSKMTIFSGLNNLMDISLDERYSEICGITENELKSYFHEGIAKLAESLEMDYTSALAELKSNYDGYHFTGQSVDIYNPFSLLWALDSSKISSYWFRSGTPTFLVKVLQNQKKPLSRILTDKVGEMSIADIDTFRTSPIALLFQTGYLTIKEFDKKHQRFTLGIPNREVETGLFTELLADNTEIEKYEVDQWAFDIRKSFEDGRPDEALSLVKSFLAGIPASVTQNKPELYYENNIYMLLRLVGCNVQAEYWTSYGRIDLLLMTDEYVYVMELKLDSSPESALEQIDTKDYALQWRTDKRSVYKIGINFLSKTRNIDDWIIEQEPK